jgi:hypothetical protein
MSKTCPNCGYTSIGPFVDNCPICAEPVRNVRSDAGRRRAGNLSPLLRWVIGGTVVAVLGVSGCCGFGLWRLGTAVKDAEKAVERAKEQAEADRKARTVVVTAARLLQEFQDDPAAADRKYRRKYLELSGVVERVGRGRNERPFVILHAGDETGMLRIECFLDPTDEGDDVPGDVPARGQAITLRGEYDGQVSNVQLRNCVLVK